MLIEAGTGGRFVGPRRPGMACAEATRDVGLRSGEAPTGLGLGAEREGGGPEYRSEHRPTPNTMRAGTPTSWFSAWTRHRMPQETFVHEGVDAT